MRLSVSPSFRASLGLLALFVSAPTLADAGGLPENFTLGRYVPDDVWFVVHGVDNPQRQWINEQWDEVFDSVAESGIDRDLTTLVLSLVGDGDRAGIDAHIEKATKLIRGVRWRDLVAREYLAAERISTGQMGAAYIGLARGAKGSGEANFDGLTAILEELSTVICCSKIVESRRRGVTIRSMRFEDEGLKKLGFSVELFRKGDLIGLTTGSGARDDVLALLAGKRTPRALTDHPRFREAIALVPPPKDMLIYSDARTLLRDMGRLLDSAQGEVGKRKRGYVPSRSDIVTASDREEPCSDGTDSSNSDDIAVELVKKIIHLADFIDYGITSVETEGRQQRSHVVTRIQPGRQNNPVAEMFFKRQRFERFDRFVPAEATAFGLSSGLDIERAYKLLTEIVSDIPGGPEKIADLNAVLASIDFDLQKDFFDWWSGEMISISLPAAVPTPLGGGDGVWMFRVKNAELATEKVNAAIDFAAEKVRGQGQMLMVSTAPVSADGFRQITLPAMAIFMRPVVGVHGDWLMLGTSPAAINKCLEVEAGETPSIRENERFKKEGLIPKGPVLAASFKDTSKSGREMAALLGLLGMGGNVFVAGLPEDTEDNRKMKSVLQSAIGVVMKLGPILRKINFYSSEASITTYDGASTVRIESVVTYKPHPPRPPKPPGANEAASAVKVSYSEPVR